MPTPEPTPGRLNPWRYIGGGLVIVTGAIVLIPFFALSNYSFPAADDFCYAQNFIAENSFLALWRHSLNWSGRYFSYLLQGSYPNWFGLFESYRFIAPVLLVLTYAAALALVSQLLGSRSSWFLKGVLALAFLLAYLLGMPEPASGFYWMAGAFTYQVGNIILLVVLAMCVKSLSGESDTGRYSFAFFGLAIVAGAGTNETTMLVIFGIMHIATLLAWILRKRLTPWAWLLSLTYICFLIVYFSPGNESRVAAFPNAHDISYALARCLYFGSVLMIQWLEQPLFWVYLALLFIASVFALPAHSLRIPLWLILVMLAGTLALPFVALFPAWWSMGGPAPERTINVIYFLFLLSASCAVILSAMKVGSYPAFGKDGMGGRVSFVVLCICFSFLCLTNPTYTRARADWNEFADGYRETWELRLEMLGAQNPEQDFALPALPRNLPETIHFVDIKPDPKDWRNECFANFVGARSVRTVIE